MKICTFQGTFNPIHNAHLAMADYVARYYDYDKIIFIPACQPPHKCFDENMSLARLDMVELAVKDNPMFEVSDIEFKRPEPSFTYVTICELYKNYPIDGKVGFIIGEDAFADIESWHNADDLKNLVDFIVFVRSNNFNKERFAELGRKGYNYSIANLEFTDISSTQVRKLAHAGQPITELVPANVWEYIEQHELYKSKS